MQTESSKFREPPKISQQQAQAEDEIPAAPPVPLRGQYLSVSWQYVAWCIGMLTWSLLCVVYFILTSQTTNMIIGISLGALLVAMIALPTVLFGGKTWYKRLGWVMALLSMFSVMWVYPMIVMILGVSLRIRQGRYHAMTANDIWHVSLCVLTVAMSLWTILVTYRAGRLVHRLSQGDWEEKRQGDKGTT